MFVSTLKEAVLNRQSNLLLPLFRDADWLFRARSRRARDFVRHKQMLSYILMVYIDIIYIYNVCFVI